MVSISIVIAAYNEAATLKDVFHRCLKVAASCADDFEIVILDDASQDETPRVAAELVEEHGDVLTVVTHEVNQGIAITFEELFRLATKQYVFDVPADGEYPPEVLPKIIPLLDEFDCVVCNRAFKRYTVYRRIVSWSYRWLPRILFGVEMYDPGSTKCRRRELIQEITITSKGVFAEAERLIRASRRGYRIGKIDIQPDRRLAGDPQGAKLSNVVQAAKDVVSLWWRLMVLRQSP